MPHVTVLGLPHNTQHLDQLEDAIGRLFQRIFSGKPDLLSPACHFPADLRRRRVARILVRVDGISNPRVEPVAYEQLAVDLRGALTDHLRRHGSPHLNAAVDVHVYKKESFASASGMLTRSAA